MGIFSTAVASMLPVLTRVLSGVFDHFGVPIVRALARQGQLPAAAAAGLPRVVIVGDGGAGKSTLLKQMLARAGSAGRVPVWVPLAGLATDGPLTPAVLIDHLVRQAHGALGLDEVNDAFFRALVDEGRLAIGFDALDECGSLARRQKVRGLIVEVAREWKRCQVFVTSRPDALRDTPLPLLSAPRPAGEEPKSDEFFAFEPVPFGGDDVAPFLKAAFDDDGSLARTLLMRTGMEALLETPLTLTLVGLVARTAKAGLPATRTPLFAQCLKTVAETWEDAKGGPPSDGLDPAQRLDALRRLGWEAQQVDGDRLVARAARRALAQVPTLAPRAEAIVNGLVRRNLLLRAETSDAGEVQQIRFSHPQFREYLAGAHLAEQLALDEKAAAAAMARHWFDSGWLEVLRFAVASVENDAELRDALLRAILAADDPYRDLLRRPEFLVARLAARLSSADAGLLGQVVATLEMAAQQEPALLHEATRLLLGLGSHCAAQPAIRRFAEGAGIARAFPDSDRASDAERLEAFRWRLRAIEALAQGEGPAAALALLQRLAAPQLQHVVEVSELRMRLHDRDGARKAWRAAFEAGDANARTQVAASMDRAGDGAEFDLWLLAHVAGNGATVRDVALARERKLPVDYDAAWRRLFTAAMPALGALAREQLFAPEPLAAAVYAALDIEIADVAARDAQHALLAAALGHPAFTWIVGPRVGGRFPDLRADAVAALVSYVLSTNGEGAVRYDRSRVGGAVQAVSDEPDDALAVPALRELLRRFDPDQRWATRVAESLARRGHGREALEDLAPILALPAGVEPGGPDPEQPRREMAWRLARELDWPATRSLLDAKYRRGKPKAAAERLMSLWNASGVGPLAREWFAELATDEEGREFLRVLTTHERDTFFTDSARHALYGGVFDDGFDNDETPAPWTLANYEQAFEFALAQGRFVDERDRDKDASVRDLLGLLGGIVAAGDAAAALRHADDWVQRTLADPAPAPGEKAEQLAEQLYGLARRGLHDERWVAPVAAFARTVAPGHRVSLVDWLIMNA
jgi:hypothetical protein